MIKKIKLQLIPSNKKYLVVIGGPTASGKTALSLRLAKMFGCSIISADSRQFYREMTIGTAKPSIEELSQSTHYFIDSLSIHDPYSVGQYERDALALMDTLFDESPVQILTGGTGLFIKAVCEGLDHFPKVSRSVVNKYNNLLDNKGLVHLQLLLEEADAEYAAKVDIQNPQRLIRALSVIEVSGLPFSSFLKKQPAKRNFKAIYLCLILPRQELYRRIDERVDTMVEKGLEEEARSLYNYKHLQALQTVGYKELFRFFDGRITRQEAIEKIKQHSRNYAKRQMTWFTNQGNWNFFNPEEKSQIMDHLYSIIDTDHKIIH